MNYRRENGRIQENKRVWRSLEMDTNSELARALEKKYRVNTHNEMKVSYPVHTKAFKEIIEKEVSLIKSRLNEEKSSDYKGGNK